METLEKRGGYKGYNLDEHAPVVYNYNPETDQYKVKVTLTGDGRTYRNWMSLRSASMEERLEKGSKCSFTRKIPFVQVRQLESKLNNPKISGMEKRRAVGAACKDILGERKGMFRGLMDEVGGTFLEFDLVDYMIAIAKRTGHDGYARRLEEKYFFQERLKGSNDGLFRPNYS